MTSLPPLSPLQSPRSPPRSPRRDTARLLDSTSSYPGSTLTPRVRRRWAAELQRDRARFSSTALHCETVLSRLGPAPAKGEPPSELRTAVCADMMEELVGASSVAGRLHAELLRAVYDAGAVPYFAKYARWKKECERLWVEKRRVEARCAAAAAHALRRGRAVNRVSRAWQSTVRRQTFLFWRAQAVQTRRLRAALRALFVRRDAQAQLRARFLAWRENAARLRAARQLAEAEPAKPVAAAAAPAGPCGECGRLRRRLAEYNRRETVLRGGPDKFRARLDHTLDLVWLVSRRAAAASRPRLDRALADAVAGADTAADAMLRWVNARTGLQARTLGPCFRDGRVLGRLAGLPAGAFEDDDPAVTVERALAELDARGLNPGPIVTATAVLEGNARLIGALVASLMCGAEEGAGCDAAAGVADDLAELSAVEARLKELRAQLDALGSAGGGDGGGGDNDDDKNNTDADEGALADTVEELDRLADTAGSLAARLDRALGVDDARAAAWGEARLGAARAAVGGVVAHFRGAAPSAAEAAASAGLREYSSVRGDLFDEGDAEMLGAVLGGHAEHLRRVFRHYACSADGSASTMDSGEFYDFVRDCRMLTRKKRDGRLTNVDCDLVFRRVNWDGGEGGEQGGDSSNPDRELVPSEFVEALCRLARRKFGELAPADALRRLLEKHVSLAAASVADEFRKALAAPEVRDVFKRYRKALRKVFRHYADGGGGGRAKAVLNRVQNDSATVNMEEWRLLLQDAGLVDATLTVPRANAIFSSVQQAAGGEPDDAAEDCQMNFAEFVEAVAAVAAYRSPDPYRPFHQRLAETLTREFFPPLLHGRSVPGLKKLLPAS